jgi:hypothetical protein
LFLQPSLLMQNDRDDIGGDCRMVREPCQKCGWRAAYRAS